MAIAVELAIIMQFGQTFPVARLGRSMLDYNYLTSITTSRRPVKASVISPEPFWREVSG
jgi:hypothetical protein